MPLPTVMKPYPLGPYSLDTPVGRYWFPSTFLSSHLIPGSAQEELTAGEDRQVWERLGDGERLPAVLTLAGGLIPFAGLEGLRQDVRTLRGALADATKLIRNNGDGTTREVAIDGGLATVQAAGRHFYRAVVTVYPVSAVVTTGAEVAPPVLHVLTTEAGEDLVTEHDEMILVVA